MHSFNTPICSTTVRLLIALTLVAECRVDLWAFKYSSRQAKALTVVNTKLVSCRSIFGKLNCEVLDLKFALLSEIV
jgi:hypothetical protein